MPWGTLPLVVLAFAWAPPIVPEGASVEILTRDVSFAEGPAAGPDGAIYFSDIPTGEKKGRILRFDPRTSAVSVFRADSGKSNGLFFDALGRLVACEGADFGGRRISRSTSTGPAETVVDRFEGRRFNAPNDLCIDRGGRIWFSDPKYLGAEPRELDHRSVYRVDPDGSLHRVATQPEIDKPNGVAVSPDGSTLYVADNCEHAIELPGGGSRPGRLELVAFPIREDGSLGGKRVLVDLEGDGGVDGMTVDREGRVYAAVRSRTAPGIRVYSPEGKELARIPTPGTPTNCTFGRGEGSDWLYITMDDGLGRIRLNARGAGLGEER